MQTDETRAREVLAGTMPEGSMVQHLVLSGQSPDQEMFTIDDAIRAMLAFNPEPHTIDPRLDDLIRRNTVAKGYPNTVAIAEEAFEMGVKSAAPPAVEREEVIAGLDGVWAWIEHLPQGDTAQEHLNAIDAARVALSSPTLHPSDREAIAEALWNVGERDRYNMSWERAKAENHNWVVGCYMHTDAILALSGSLAPEGGV